MSVTFVIIFLVLLTSLFLLLSTSCPTSLSPFLTLLIFSFFVLFPFLILSLSISPLRSYYFLPLSPLFFPNLCFCRISFPLFVSLSLSLIPYFFARFFLFTSSLFPPPFVISTLLFLFFLLFL